MTSIEHPACVYCCAIDRSSSKKTVRNSGSYSRKCDGVTVRRFRCDLCARSFSDATGTFEYRQRVRHINSQLFELMASAVSQRKATRIMKVNRKTIARRLPYFSNVSEAELSYLRFSQFPSRKLQFDDMESFEQTKLKPLSIPLIVCGERRLILSFDVVSMPAKGARSSYSVEKYGLRTDDRKIGWYNTLSEVALFFTEGSITTDLHTSYPKMVRTLLPSLRHIQVKGRLPKESGFGELKIGGFDPLFALNHTAASIRYSVNRLARKTWCTTKKQQCLKQHIAVYTLYHNEIILAREEKRKPKFPFPGG